jgi:hypothetical protein
MVIGDLKTNKFKGILEGHTHIKLWTVPRTVCMLRKGMRRPWIIIFGWPWGSEQEGSEG